MTNHDRARIIKTAISEYETVKLLGGDASHAINMMENVYIMCAVWSAPKSEELRKLLLAIKEGQR